MTKNVDWEVKNETKRTKTVQWFYYAILGPYMGVIPNPKMAFSFRLHVF